MRGRTGRWCKSLRALFGGGVAVHHARASPKRPCWCRMSLAAVISGDRVRLPPLASIAPRAAGSKLRLSPAGGLSRRGEHLLLTCDHPNPVNRWPCGTSSAGSSPQAHEDGEASCIAARPASYPPPRCPGNFWLRRAMHDFTRLVHFSAAPRMSAGSHSAAAIPTSGGGATAAKSVTTHR